MESDAGAKASQAAIGHHIAQALAPGATAAVFDHAVIQHAELQVTEAVAKALVDCGIDLSTRPTAKQLLLAASDRTALSARLFFEHQPGNMHPLDVAYVDRRRNLPETFSSVRRALDLGGKLLIRARKGAGKTRLLYELAAALVDGGWTAFQYDTMMSRPTLPQSLPLEGVEKAVLLIDNLETVAGTPSELREWLGELVRMFARRLLPAEFRVIATCKSEPYFTLGLGLTRDVLLWNELHVWELPDLEDQSLSDILSSLTGVDEAASRLMIEESDHTPATIFQRVRTIRNRKLRLTIDIWRQFADDDWRERVPLLAERSPDSAHVLSTVLLLQSAGLAWGASDIQDLAQRFGVSNPQSAIPELINYRLAISDSGNVIRAFSTAQLDRQMIDSGISSKSLESAWPDIAAIVQARASREERAPDLLTLARALLRSGQPLAAANLAREAVRCSSTGGAESDFILALAHLLQGQTEAARAEAKSAIAKGKRTGAAYFVAGLLDFLCQDLRSAQFHIAEARRSSPDSVEFLVTEALICTRLGFTERAEAALNGDFDFGELDSTVLLLRGTLLLQRGSREAAVVNFNRAIERGRKDSSIYLLRGFALATTNPAIADDDLTAALGTGYASAAILIARGWCRFQSGRIEESEQDFSNALAMEPESKAAYACRAVIRAARNQLPSAEEDLSSAINLSTDHAEMASLLRSRAQIRWELKKFQLSGDDLERAAQLEPQSRSWLARIVAGWRSS